MIIIIDTNAYHGDVHLSGQHVSALFGRVAAGALPDTEIWTPRGVVHELVRQFSARARRMNKALDVIKRDLASFGLERPRVPQANQASVQHYKANLEQRLTGARRRIAEYPPSIGLAIDWAGQHRHPVKPFLRQPPKGEKDLSVFADPKTAPTFGVVDASIWLTVIEAARTGSDVVLISANVKDFADPKDESKLHPQLIDDLESVGVDPSKVSRVNDVLSFNEKYLPAEKSADEEARAFLADDALRETLSREISDAVEWYEMAAGSEWGLGVDIDYATLASFEPSAFKLIRADPAPDGFYMTLRVTGDARLDLGIFKSDAYNMDDSRSVVAVYDWDWNESMVAAEADLPATLQVEARLKKGDVMVSIEYVRPAASGSAGDQEADPA